MTKIKEKRGRERQLWKVLVDGESNSSKLTLVFSIFRLSRHYLFLFFGIIHWRGFSTANDNSATKASLLFRTWYDVVHLWPNNLLGREVDDFIIPHWDRRWFESLPINSLTKSTWRWKQELTNFERASFYIPDSQFDVLLKIFGQLF